MTAPPWKRMVEELSARGYESPHLERLKQRLPMRDGYQSLQLEILQEMASSLGRASEKVDHALLKLELVGRQIDEADDAGTRARLVGDFNAQREVALKFLWELKVHREAIGLRQHHGLAQMYPVPPKRT